MRSGAEVAGRFGDELSLCNISVATFPLEQIIPAAAAAGFRSISVLGRAYRRSLTKGGLTPEGLRSLLDHHGVAVRDVEAVGDWLGPNPFGEDSIFHPAYDTDGYLAMAEALGATTLVAVHFGGAAPLPEAAGAFAWLCDRAAERGLRVALEFPAFATIGDVATAWRIVQAAGRRNGGVLLDNWHHRRSAATDADLAAVPAESIFSVQVCDATALPVGPLIDDVAERLLPGTGALAVAPFVAELERRGVRCPLGIEVLRKEIVSSGVAAAAQLLYTSLSDVVSASRAAR